MFYCFKKRKSYTIHTNSQRKKRVFSINCNKKIWFDLIIIFWVRFRNYVWALTLMVCHYGRNWCNYWVCDVECSLKVNVLNCRLLWFLIIIRKTSVWYKSKPRRRFEFNRNSIVSFMTLSISFKGHYQHCSDNFLGNNFTAI